jgi:hypothetical protein
VRLISAYSRSPSLRSVGSFAAIEICSAYRLLDPAPETDVAFELPDFRFVSVIGSTEFLKFGWRSFERMMVATEQEASDP